MNAPRIIPEAVRRLQIAASDPATSAWVSANAGSGKTHVLAQRVIRLLLEGTSPAKILCLTFTKAAAANMANRIFETLGKWVKLDDAALDAAIREIGVRDTGPKRRALEAVIPIASDFVFQLALNEAIQERNEIAAWLDYAGGLDAAGDRLSAA